VEEGAVPAIVSLLRSPVESMQEHAAVTLRNLSLNDDNEVWRACTHASVCACLWRMIHESACPKGGLSVNAFVFVSV
jgi:hypothetical protein